MKGISRRGLSGMAKIPRNPLFASLNPDDLRVFKDIVGEKGMVTDKDDLVPHNTDWTKKYLGEGKLLLRPTTT